LVNYEGFDSNSVLMSKFGVRVTDEMTLIISKERFEIYIGELMKTIPNVKNYLRPNEGDLIYIPLSNSLMEIKYVENKKPFYQLQKTYVYELRCEAYELEDDVIETGLSDIDRESMAFEYTANITLSGIGSTATAYSGIVSGAIQKIDMVNGGYKYSETPSIVISAPTSGTQATAVGVMTSSRTFTSSYSLDQVYLINPGSGYTSTPTVSFFGGNGYGASVKVSISTSGSIGIVTISNVGQGYIFAPTVSFSSPVSGGTTAIAKAILSSVGTISSIRIINSGYGYTQAPTITIGAGVTISQGNFFLGEKVIGQISNAVGTVNSWDASTRKLKVTGFGTNFTIGDVIVGSASSATYIISKYESFETGSPYDNSNEIQEESDKIIEFDDLNPFGEV